MWNLMKGLNYQIKRDNFTIYAILFSSFLAIGISFYEALVEEGMEFSEISAGLFLAKNAEFLVVGCLVLCCVLVARIVGWDMTDKTINYEILAGNSRNHVFGARVILTFLWCLGISVIYLVLPLVVLSFCNGWGPNLEIKVGVSWVLIFILLVFRLVCELILLTVLLKNCFISMIIGWILNEFVVLVTLVYEEMIGDFPVFLFSLSGMFQFSTFPYKFEYIGGKDIPVFGPPIGSGEIMQIIISVIVVSGLTLLVAKTQFNKQDMR